MNPAVAITALACGFAPDPLRELIVAVGEGMVSLGRAAEPDELAGPPLACALAFQDLHSVAAR